MPLYCCIEKKSSKSFLPAQIAVGFQLCPYVCLWAKLKIYGEGAATNFNKEC